MKNLKFLVIATALSFSFNSGAGVCNPNIQYCPVELEGLDAVKLAEVLYAAVDGINDATKVTYRNDGSGLADLLHESANPDGSFIKCTVKIIEGTWKASSENASCTIKSKGDYTF